MQWNVDTDGYWHAAANWSSNPSLPGASDDVTINVLPSITVTHSTGDDTINSLTCNQAFVLSGGSLSIITASQFNSTFSLTGGTLGGNGDLTASGLTKSGDGVLDVLGAINYAGDTTITAGEMRVTHFNPATAATAHIDVQGGASLVADSIVADTLTIAAGGSVTIRETAVGAATGAAAEAVPEPGTWVLIGTALLGLLAFRRRR